MTGERDLVSCHLCFHVRTLGFVALHLAAKSRDADAVCHAASAPAPLHIASAAVTRFQETGAENSPF